MLLSHAFSQIYIKLPISIKTNNNITFWPLGCVQYKTWFGMSIAIRPSCCKSFLTKICGLVPSIFIDATLRGIPVLPSSNQYNLLQDIQVAMKSISTFGSFSYLVTSIWNHRQYTENTCPIIVYIKSINIIIPCLWNCSILLVKCMEVYEETSGSETRFRNRLKCRAFFYIWRY